MTTQASSLTYDDLGTSAQRERHTRILDATIALASQGGYDAVQMRAVAERAEVALGTLYRYFPSKVHLLVSALARELDRARAGLERKPVPGDTPADRVVHVLDRITGTLQRDPRLAEALVRAFMFADASVAREIGVVAGHVERLLLGAMAGTTDGGAARPAGTDEPALARVVADVWLARMVQWVNGRATAAEVTHSLEVAVRLLLR